LEECNNKIGKELGPKVFNVIQSAFDVLPLACLIGNRILVVHGGIGNGQWKVGDVRTLKRPIREDQLNQGMINDILWSDPIEDDDEQMEQVFGVHDSPRGAKISLFSWSVTTMFCARNGLSLIVRSHQSKKNSPGVDVMHEHLLMRVFSARDYEGHGNDGAVLLIRALNDSSGLDVLTVRAQVLGSLTKAKIEEDARIKGRASQGSAERQRRKSKWVRRKSE